MARSRRLRGHGGVVVVASMLALDCSPHGGDTNSGGTSGKDGELPEAGFAAGAAGVGGGPTGPADTGSPSAVSSTGNMTLEAGGGPSPVSSTDDSGPASYSASAEAGASQPDASDPSLSWDGAPNPDGDGDYTVGPTYTTSPDLMSQGAPTGQSFQFTMSSTTSQIFTGMDATLAAANQHSFTREVNVYVPAKYVDGTAAPFMVIQDGPGTASVQLPLLYSNVKIALDNLTQSTDPTRRLPAFIAIAVANGGGDGVGTERGLEYDTMSDAYARFVEDEVLPAVLADATIKAAFPNFGLTTDPDGRGTLGCSSGSAAALSMGWFHPEWFHRIVTYSGTFVDQQNPAAPEQAMYPLGAWDYHSDLDLIGTTATKPLRVFVNANEMDNGYNAPASGYHNWLIANQRTAAALASQGYHYRFVEGLGAGHCDSNVQNLTMADTLVWAWQGYATAP